MSLFKRSSKQSPAPEESSPEAQSQSKSGVFARLKSSLSKTRASFTEGLYRLVAGKKQIDEELLEELETLLLMADIGTETTTEIIDSVTAQVARRELTDPQAVVAAIQRYLVAALSPYAAPLDWRPGEGTRVVLIVGVNGVGKTTTLAKLAARLQEQGLSPMLAAGDTFRAAGVAQLQQWGKRCGCPVIAQSEGADSASVIHDAIQAAQSRGRDVLLADTAGRLHNKSNLMAELAKVRRVAQRLEPNAPHETLLVVDATTGQNALSQAEAFNEVVPLTGIILTKLDGTAKGGIVVSLTQRLGLPIRYIGVGEGIDDLRPFSAEEFVAALMQPAETTADDGSEDYAPI